MSAIGGTGTVAVPGEAFVGVKGSGGVLVAIGRPVGVLVSLGVSVGMSVAAVVAIRVSVGAVVGVSDRTCVSVGIFVGIAVGKDEGGWGRLIRATIMAKIPVIIATHIASEMPNFGLLGVSGGVDPPLSICWRMSFESLFDESGINLCFYQTTN